MSDPDDRAEFVYVMRKLDAAFLANWLEKHPPPKTEDR